MTATPQRTNQKSDGLKGEPKKARVDDQVAKRATRAEQAERDVAVLASLAHEAVESDVAKLRARCGVLRLALESPPAADGNDGGTTIVDEAQKALKRALRKFRKQYSLAKPDRKAKPSSSTQTAPAEAPASES